jgi:lipoyl-dependent peroxiredoxin
MKPLYTAKAVTVGGRNGHIRSEDGLLDLDVSVPKSMGGPGKEGTSNPEQLFAAAYSACFGGAVEVSALQKRLHTEPVTITADVTIGKDDAGAFQLAVTLTGRIPGQTAAAVQELMVAAHQICPYSRATRGNIEVKLVGAA